MAAGQLRLPRPSFGYTGDLATLAIRMSSTRPAILLNDLFSGDGPHGDLADRFVEGRCVQCGTAVARGGREGDERWYCLTCWGRGQLRLGVS